MGRKHGSIGDLCFSLEGHGITGAQRIEKKKRGGGAGLGQMEIQADINLDLALTNVTISTRGVQGALHRLNR